MSTQEGEVIGYFTNVFDHKTFLLECLLKISRKSLGTLPKATAEFT